MALSPGMDPGGEQQEKKMIVTIRYSGKKDDVDYDASCKVEQDGKAIATGFNFAECPEDANMMRDLEFIYDLPEALRKSYEAGRRGEPFTIRHVEDSR